MANNSSNEQDVKTKINLAIINNNNYYYTLSKKQANTISLLSNSRLLIFNQKQGTLYFVNEPSKIPFQVSSTLTKPKKQIVNISLAIIKYQAKSKVISIQYNKKSDKNAVVGGQWKFEFQTEELAEKWYNFLKSMKQEKTAKALGINKQSAGNINDVLSFGFNKQYSKNIVNQKDSQLEVVPQNLNQNKVVGLDKYTNRHDESMLSKSKILNKTQILQNDSKRENPNLLGSWNLTEYRKVAQPNLPSKSQAQKSIANSKLSYKQPSKYQTFGEQSKISQNKSNLTLNPIPIQIKPAEGSGIRSAQKQPANNMNSSVNNRLNASNANNTSSIVNNRSSSLLKVSAQNSHPQLKKSQASHSNSLIKSNAFRTDGAEDWNKRFLSQRNYTTIKNFSQFALQVFMQLSPQKMSLRSNKQQQANPKIIQKKGITFFNAEHGTKLAKKLKRQFSNYHFILQNCKQNTFINVPLCCMIYYMGIVCLAKACLPSSAQIVQNLNNNNEKSVQILQQLRTLQLYSKISSENIRRQATILDLSKSYGNSENILTIYIDNLIQYLPDNPESIYPYQFPIRSQLVYDNFSKVINPRVQQSRQQIKQNLNNSVNQLCEILSQHKQLIISYGDLKQLMHQYGINTKMISRLYLGTKSRLAKKFLHSAMLSRIVKSDIYRTMADFRQSKQVQQMPRIIQQGLRVYCQNQNSQAWKNVAQEFKKRYRIVFNLNQIQPTFFLSSLLTMIPAQYNIQNLDKNKKLFQDIGIIKKDFVSQIIPKLKTYDKFKSQSIERLMNLCRSNKNNINQINQMLNINKSQIELAKQNKNKLNIYLSNYISPFSKQYAQKCTQMYSKVNEQPPSILSHQITLNFVRFCQKQNKTEQYKQIIQDAVDIISYWLGEDHPLLCDIYESLSDYYGRKGDSEGSVNFMKQALTTCIRSTGTHTDRAASQYFKLAERQLRCGQKADAMENYYKAKLNMEGLGQKNPQYTILLMKIATIELSQNNPTKCINLAIKAIKSSQDKEISDESLIKIYQLLSRAYQINESKQQLNNLGHLTAKVFNNTESQYTFDLMTRICVISFIMTLLPGKQQRFEEYVGWIKRNYNGKFSGKQAIRKLMLLAQQNTVLQKFWKGLDNIQKYLAQARVNRVATHQSKEMKNIFQLVLTLLGFDFVEGILGQAKYW